MTEELKINIINSEYLVNHFLDAERKTKEIVSLQSILNSENALIESMLIAMGKLENIFDVN
jgi:hypothetical protein